MSPTDDQHINKISKNGGKSHQEIFLVNQDLDIKGGKALSPAETRFFEIISDHIQKFAIHPNSHIFNETPKQRFYAYLISPYISFFTNILELQIDRDLADENISRDMANKIRKSFIDEIKFLFMAPFNDHNSFEKHYAIIRDIIRQELKLTTISQEAKNYVLQCYNNSSEVLSKYFECARVVSAEDLFSQLTNGRLTYTSPIFTSISPREFIHFAFLTRNAIQRFNNVGEEERISATAAIVARLEEHEKMLIDKKAARQANKGERKAAGKAVSARMETTRADWEATETQRRAVEKQERHTAFMAVPQRYALDREALQIWTQIQNFASSTARDAKNASILVSTISQEEQKVKSVGGVPFDIRHDDIKELGDVLLSASNLLQAARAYSADNNLRDAKIIIPHINKSGEYLRGLYRSYDSVSRAVDALLQSNDGIVLLASLLLPQSTCKAYASSLRANLSQYNTLQKKIEAFEAQLEGLDGDEEALMRDVLQQDENYQALLAKRNHTFIDNNRETLEFQIRQVLQGRAAKKVASANFIAADEEPEKTKKLPVGWSPNSGDDIAVKAHPDDTQSVLIISTDYPFIQRTVQRTASGKALKRTIEEVRAQCAQYTANEELMKPLIEEEGFKITSQENIKVILHPEYAISIPFHRDENSETRQLLDAIALCAERKLQQESIFRTAIECGIAVSQDPQTRAITLAHHDDRLGTITIAPRGYLSKDDFDTIEAWIARVSVQPETSQTQEAIEEEHTEANHEVWKPEESQTFVIFDATTLSRLSSSRDNGRTWLDIIKQTSKLPNVKVVIPSVIAFWEMQGKIPLFDAEGKISGFEQVNSNYSHSGHFLHHIASETENFLQAAPIVHINADGTTHVAQEGISKNIVVMQTDGDKALYDRIRDIHAKSDSYNILNSRLDAEIYGKDEGENSISRILKEVPFGCAALVVSDDLKFLRDKLPFQTGQKKPVSAAGTNTYIDAALAADAFGLQKKLGLRTVPTLSAIGGQIAAFQAEHRAERGKLFMATHSGRGGGDGIKPGKSVYEIIAAGVKKTKNMWAIRTIRPAASQVIAL